MKNNQIIFFLLVLILADLSYSFLQYQNQPFGGDLVPLIHPSERNATILENPLGIKAITEGVQYAGVNRYFAHQSLAIYFKNVPNQLQLLVSPIDSLYISAALFKLFCQVLLTYLVCSFVLVRFKVFSIAFLGLFLLIGTFFQTHGYYHNIGIIDSSITYVFFYAFPIAMLLLFLLFIYQRWQEVVDKKLSLSEHMIILVLLIYLPLSGGIIAPLSLMIFVVLFTALLWEKQLKITINKISKAHRCYILLYILCCIYSYYLSGYNAENKAVINYWEGIARCLDGLFFIGTSKLAIPMFALCLLVNIWLLRKSAEPISPKIKRILIWLWVFLLLYLLALPLGGFRDYRPNLIRHDTFIPVTLGILFSVGLTTKLVYQRMENNRFYLIFVTLIMLIFTIADSPHFNDNDCERTLLLSIQNSRENELSLPADCTIFSWDKTERLEDSRMIGNMLRHWNIVDRAVLFEQTSKD